MLCFWHCGGERSCAVRVSAPNSVVNRTNNKLWESSPTCNRKGWEWMQAVLSSSEAREAESLSLSFWSALEHKQTNNLKVANPQPVGKDADDGALSWSKMTLDGYKAKEVVIKCEDTFVTCEKKKKSWEKRRKGKKALVVGIKKLPKKVRHASRVVNCYSLLMIFIMHLHHWLKAMMVIYITGRRNSFYYWVWL